MAGNSGQRGTTRNYLTYRSASFSQFDTLYAFIVNGTPPADMFFRTTALSYVVDGQSVQFGPFAALFFTLPRCKRPQITIDTHVNFSAIVGSWSYFAINAGSALRCLSASKCHRLSAM